MPALMPASPDKRRNRIAFWIAHHNVMMWAILLPGSEVFWLMWHTSRANLSINIQIVIFVLLWVVIFSSRIHTHSFCHICSRKVPLDPQRTIEKKARVLGLWHQFHDSPRILIIAGLIAIPLVVFSLIFRDNVPLNIIMIMILTFYVAGSNYLNNVHDPSGMVPTMPLGR